MTINRTNKTEIEKPKIFKQNYDFTYWKILSTKMVVSWPDHVFGSSNNQCIKTVKLLSNDNNFW